MPDTLETERQAEVPLPKLDNIPLGAEISSFLMVKRAKKKMEEIQGLMKPEDMRDPKLLQALNIKKTEVLGFIKSALRNELPSALAKFDVKNVLPDHSDGIKDLEDLDIFSDTINQAIEKVFSDTKTLGIEGLEAQLTGMLGRSDEQIAEDFIRQRIGSYNKQHPHPEVPESRINRDFFSPELNAVKVGSTIKVMGLRGKPIDAKVVGHAESGALIVEYRDSKYVGNNYRLIDDNKKEVLQKERRLIGIDEYIHCNREGQASNPEQSDDKEKQKQLIDDLWPNGMEHERLRQGGSGDCYFLSAWDAIREKYPEAHELMEGTIRHISWGEGYAVRFKGIADRDIIVTENDLMRMEGANKSIISGSKGDRILEVAYAKIVSARVSGEKKGSTTMTALDMYTKDGTAKKDLDFEGGVSIKAFADLLGEDGVDKKTFDLIPAGFGDKDMIKKAVDAYNESSIATAGSLQKPKDKKENEDEYDIVDAKGETQKVIYGHAYSVRDIDHTANTITIVNPHDTAREPIVLTKEVFLQQFRTFSIVFMKGKVGEQKEQK